MKIVEEKSKGWFQDMAIVFSSSYKIGEFEDQICKCRWWRTVATQSKSLKEIQRFFFRTKYLQFIHLGNDIPFLSYQLITFLPLWNLTPGWKAQDSADGGILLPQNERCALPVLEPKDLSVLDHRSWKIPFSARNVKSTAHIAWDSFSRLPRQWLLQINKCGLSTATRV